MATHLYGKCKSPAFTVQRNRRMGRVVYRVVCRGCGIALAHWSRANPKRHARVNGVIVTRVNRHHRKRAWLERDAVVRGLIALFRWIERCAFDKPGPQTLMSLLHGEFDRTLFAELTRPSTFKLGHATVTADGLFVFKSRRGNIPWMPSRWIPYEDRDRGMWRREP